MRGTVIFDESAFCTAEMLQTYGAFAIVNKSVKTGRDRDGNLLDPIRLRSLPKSPPYQKFYISSASTTEMEYYRLFREFAKNQLIGDPDYFVAYVDCEVAFHPTIHGQEIEPLLTQSMVQTALRTNPEKARREYYCEFTTENYADSIIKRGTITRNSETRVPLLYNDTNDKKFVIMFDPARSKDNSAILVAEIYKDKDKTYKARIVNCISLIDVHKKNKTPMQTPDQIRYLKELILAYNGNAPDYENIEAIYIDAGAGGGGVNIADFLMEDWVDKHGVKHRGLIDKEYSAEYVRKFPNAIDKLRLMPPSKYKSMMFEALIEMMEQNIISFTDDYDGKGYLTIFEKDEAQFEKDKKRIEEKLKKKNLSEEQYNQKLSKELDKVTSLSSKVVKLDKEQEAALINIDALKEELINIVRRKRDSGKDSFELVSEKANRMHKQHCVLVV